jgi:hypothetical protein
MMEEEKLISVSQLEVNLLKELVSNELDELDEKDYGDHVYFNELENLYERLNSKNSNEFEVETYDPLTKESAQVFGQGVNAVKMEGLLELWMDGLIYTACFDHYNGRKRLLIYQKDREEPIAVYEG